MNDFRGRVAGSRLRPAPVFALLVACAATLVRAEAASYSLASPDGSLVVRVDVEDAIRWSLARGGESVIEPSLVALRLGDGSVLGADARVVSDRVERIDSRFDALHYVRAVVPDRYAQLTLELEGDYGLHFRAYDDAVAYRFFTSREGELVVAHEEAHFEFARDHRAFIPYMWDYRGGHIFNASFESPYTEERLSEWDEGSLAILPMLVVAGEQRKVAILEADLESYPGMYLKPGASGRGLQAVFPQYPLETELGGFRDTNLIPTKRADYIAKTKGTRTFPWRVAIVAEKDVDLISNDIVQRLASPPRLEDTSWIVPGQVAWDWWDGYNLFGVDFEAGMNTATFEHYLDFAAENGIPYVILDAGWSETFDLMALDAAVDLDRILARAEERGVGVILWALWYTVTQQMEEVFPHYAAKGVKGWKIDFVDRDDQIAVESTYEIAQLAAEHRMLVDYHGVFKPTGLQRTWPNVVGYEGVYGLENFKWADNDAPRYAVTLPYTRNLAGPMDYTSGAMRNATREAFKARQYAPMAKGTRCNQLAQYIVFEVPLQMLSDSPSTYRREQQSTDFITRIPTSFDETRPLGGEVAEYVVVARRKGETWYVAAMTNWTPRSLSIDLSFLGEGDYAAVVFEDGANAAREATDYVRSERRLKASETLSVELAPGGGWAAVLEKVE